MSDERLRLPERADYVEAWHRALLADEARVIDAVHATRAALASERLELLPDEGVALRPLFLSLRTIESMCAALHRAMGELQRDLSAAVARDAVLPSDIRIPRGLFAHLDVVGAYRDDAFLTAMRPDVFLYEDAALLSEPNLSNGYLPSGVFPDLVDRVLRAMPCAASLSSTMAHMPRPLDGIIDMLARRVAHIVAERRPFVALLMHHEEHEIILTWPARVILAIEYFGRRLEAAGIENRIVHEDDLVVDEHGIARLRDGTRVDLVFQIPIGTHFLYDPERFARELTHLAGTHVGDAPFLMPLAHLALDKGTMPRIGALPIWPMPLDDGRELRVIDTVYPDALDASTLRLEKDTLILKRSFEGKDTHIGPGTHVRRWTRLIDELFERGDEGLSEYVVQPYVPLPVTEMPVLRRGKIELVTVSVELSIFILDGAHAGTFARYAPTTPGVILSPPPDDMGFTLVSLV